MAISLRETYPAFLAGKPWQPNHDLAAVNPFDGRPATRVPLADAATIDQAISAAVAAAPEMRRLPPFRRAEVLRHCVGRFQERHREFAEACSVEAGKPITYALGEVDRLIDTFRVAADEALRADAGEVIPLAITTRAAGYRGMTQRVPIGPCSFITPFNFPLNLVAHKVAPAIAAGCPFVLKPADKTPVGALLIGEVLAECDLPEGAWSILPAKVEEARALVEDERLRLLSFTGSDKVGWRLKAQAGKKKVVLELGGNAACIVDETMADGRDDVVDRLVTGAYYQSGQSCISVQRIILHEAIYDQVRERLLAKVKALVHGDPADEKTFIGPLIRPEAAAGLRGRIDDAVARGARLLCGGEVGGAWGTMMSAALLENVPRECELAREEAFGPVALLSRFTDFDAALAEVNDSRFGLQAGVFTRDLARAHRAWDKLEVGGVLINETPSWRVDHMPYGGVKDSGLGREGLRYAIEDMTEVRLLVIRE
jgi:acyl-CoA reductase-like NAD-dependent aldehyde dehydrogenase